MDMFEVAERFADALAEVPAEVLRLDLGLTTVTGVPGIQSRIMYSGDDAELMLGRHDYTLDVHATKLEVSLQLYENILHHHRLFAYAKAPRVPQGMLFSVNLTTGREGGRLVYLRQRLVISNGRGTDAALLKKQRRQRRDDLVVLLRRLGLTVNSNNEVEFGSFDPYGCRFVGTTADGFLKDFLRVAILKGHFANNKGYSLTDVSGGNRS